MYDRKSSNLKIVHECFRNTFLLNSEYLISLYCGMHANDKNFATIFENLDHSTLLLEPLFVAAILRHICVTKSVFREKLALFSLQGCILI